jgi:hypothetical protein
MVEAFLKKIREFVEDAKANTSSEKEFIKYCKECLNISDEKNFLDLYYYGKVKERKRLKGGLISYDE